MRHAAWSGIDAAVVADLLEATVTLLARLRVVRDPAARGALGAAFDAQVAGLREDLRRRHGLAGPQADAIMARASARVAAIVRATLDRT